MSRSLIPINTFTCNPQDIWANQWFLLTAGDFAKGHFNTMTVAWGSMGVMWNKPFVQVVVRPTRYTLGFMEEYETFTLSGFGDQHREALNYLGTHSGRDGNKIQSAGLTPVSSSIVSAPCFDEAQLVIEARKIYWQDFDPSHFLDTSIESKYSKKDYHRAYFGEIVAIQNAEH